MTRECANRFAVITVDETTGERIVLWDRDERLNLEAREIDPRLIASARVIHVDDEDQEAAIAAATMARRAGVPCTSDIDRVTDRTRDLVAAVSIPIFAQHVLPAITGESDVERALRVVRQTHDGHALRHRWRERRGAARRRRVHRRTGFCGEGGRHDRSGRRFPRRVHLFAAEERFAARHAAVRQRRGGGVVHARRRDGGRAGAAKRSKRLLSGG